MTEKKADSNKKAVIDYKALEEITPYFRNSKEHPDKQIKKIADSIATFGFNQPIVIDTEGVIIVGHGRYFAAQLLGYSPVPTITVDIGAEEAKAYRIADNKLNESKWNLDLTMDELKSFNADLLELTGFTQLDIDRYDFQQVEKRSLSEDFIIPPFSYWDTRQKYWQKRKERWQDFFGDSREGRPDNLITEGMKRLGQVQGSDKLSGTSEFDPVVAEICYKWFNVPGGKILDPFAGGVVRGAVAGTLGYPYSGVDLSEKQIQANQESIKQIVVPITNPNYIHGDSTKLNELVPEGEQYDMVFSCPPYFDLEVYSEDPNDISNMPYDKFLETYEDIITKAVAKLKDNRFAVWVVGDVRDKDGYYRGLVPDTIRAFEKAGARFYNDIILVNSIATASLRSRRPFEQNRKVTKVHQNILAFYKGDPKQMEKGYIALPKVERIHHSVVVFYKGDIDEIRQNYKVVHTGLDI